MMHQYTSCLVTAKKVHLFSYLQIYYSWSWSHMKQVIVILFSWRLMLVIAFLNVKSVYSLNWSSFLKLHCISPIFLICFLTVKFIGPWGAWCCKFARTWRVHQSEKYSYYWTWKIWDWDVVLLPVPIRIQWLFEAVLLWVLPQFHEAQRAASEAYGEWCLK